MENIHNTVHKFLQYLSQRDLKQLVLLFADQVDWYIPGDETQVPWLGRRTNRQAIADFYELLWQNTTPISANVDHIFIDGERVVISGDFSTKMLPSGKVVDSLFFIRMTIKNEQIVTYRLLEDSYAVSNAMR